MLYLILKKNYNYKNSYILVLMNSKRVMLRKLGTFSFNMKLRLFVMTVDFIFLLELYRSGVLISPKVYKIIYRYVNNFVL